MTSTRLARTLRRVSFVAVAAMSLLALQNSTWAQQPEKAADPATAAQTPPAAAAAPTPAPAAQADATAPTPSAGEAQMIPPPPPNQQAIPAPPSNPPPGYGPPPGAPYHYYYNHPGYSGYDLAPLRPVTYRPFMFGVGLGMGSLTYSSSTLTLHEPALAYSIHLAFSITTRWMAMLAMDGSWGQFTFDDETTDPYGKRSIAVSSYTAGVQFFMLRWLYARVGLGLACLEWSDDYGDWSDCHGQTAVGAVGAEFLQTRSTAVAAELGGFVSRFPDAMAVNDRNDVWYHIGANLVLNLF